MSVNGERPASDKALVAKYIKSLIELYNKSFEDLKDKLRMLFRIIYESDEVSLYVHNEALRCNNKIIGYVSTLILYYRTDNCWNTIPSHVVSDNMEMGIEETIKNLLTQIPEGTSN